MSYVPRIDEDSIYYGVNKRTQKLIMHKRLNNPYPRGMILGSPGSGKTFAAKMEMYQVYLLYKNAQIFVIDPEGEYSAFAKTLGGTVLSIKPGSDIHINPLDLDISSDNGEENYSLWEKVDFVISIVESMLGDHLKLSEYAKSIIDSTLQELYAPYIDSLRKRGLTIDIQTCPTLKDFYAALKRNEDPEAKILAESIQIYCTGSLDMFSYKTNIDTTTRFVVYDIKYIGISQKELGMNICMNDIWNRMISNKKKSIRTWFYIDEIYWMLRQPSSAEYLDNVWKSAWLWMGALTGITMDAGELLNSLQGENMLKTSPFTMVFSQSHFGCEALGQVYNISEEQQEYIANVSPGEGLIWTNEVVLPFENIVPKTSPIYSKISEI